MHVRLYAGMRILYPPCQGDETAAAEQGEKNDLHKPEMKQTTAKHLSRFSVS